MKRVIKIELTSMKLHKNPIIEYGNNSRWVYQWDTDIVYDIQIEFTKKGFWMDYRLLGIPPVHVFISNRDCKYTYEY